MNIALIGATGFVGAAVLSTLLQRGHRVTALVRDPSKLAPQPGLTAAVADAYDADAIAAAVRASRCERLAATRRGDAAGRRVAIGTRLRPSQMNAPTPRIP